MLDGDVRLAGLSAPVNVIRDAHGVPHIQAATQDDMLVAQGYVTAQDRLWQMDAYRRNADGNLAEIMGPSLVKHDEAQRVLQFRNTAQRIYANLSAQDRARLDDYARGVNLFIAQSEDASNLPVEFKLLGYRPRAVDRSGFNQRGHDDGADARHALAHQAGARAHRGKAEQSQAALPIFIRLDRGAIVHPLASRLT